MRPAEDLASCARCGIRLAPSEVDASWKRFGTPRCDRCHNLARTEAWWRAAAGIAEQLAAAGVSPAHTSATFADFQFKVAADAESWCVGEAPGLLVNGAYGTGKTRLAAAAVRWTIMSGGSARLVPSRQLFREIWATYRDGANRTEGEVLTALCRLGLLVIDDLGPGREGRVTEAVIGALHEIVSTRLDHRRQTIVTTNLSHAEIAHHYGGAIASRLSAYEPIVLRGGDWRVKL